MEYNKNKMPKKGDVVYDPSENPFNVADIDEIIDNVHSILIDLNDKNIRNMRDSNFDEYYKYMEEKYKQFSDEHYAIFDKVATFGIKNNNDLSPLFYMLEACRKIKENKLSAENAENKVGTMLQKKYGINKL